MKLNVKPFERLRAAMILSGYTQEKLCNAIGMSYSAFNLKINGKREFTLRECRLIAEKLGKTVDEIFFSENIPKREQKKAI